MSYEGFFPSGGPSIMRVMADHYVCYSTDRTPLLTPRYPLGLSLSLSLTCIISIASNASRYPRLIHHLTHHVSSRPTDHIPLLASRYHQGLSPSHLASHSPASSVLPQMPPIVHRPGLIKVASAESGLSRYPS